MISKDIEINSYRVRISLKTFSLVLVVCKRSRRWKHWTIEHLHCSDDTSHSWSPLSRFRMTVKRIRAIPCRAVNRDGAVAYHSARAPCDWFRRCPRCRAVTVPWFFTLIRNLLYESRETVSSRLRLLLIHTHCIQINKKHIQMQ
jgi:hypothetical protein